MGGRGVGVQRPGLVPPGDPHTARSGLLPLPLRSPQEPLLWRPIFLQGGHAGLGKGVRRRAQDTVLPAFPERQGPRLQRALSFCVGESPSPRESPRGNSAADSPGRARWPGSQCHPTARALPIITISCGGRPGPLLGVQGGDGREWKLLTEPGPSLTFQTGAWPQSPSPQPRGKLLHILQAPFSASPRHSARWAPLRRACSVRWPVWPQGQVHLGGP